MSSYLCHNIGREQYDLCRGISKWKESVNTGRLRWHYISTAYKFFLGWRWMPVSSLAEIICNYRYCILDECIFLPVQCNSLLTAFLQGFITVFLSEVQDAKTHAVGLDFIQPWFKNSADNGFRILSNKLGFLDKVWAIPRSKSFIIIRQMLWICRPLAFSCCSWPFTKKFSGKRINTDNSWGWET